MSVLSDCSIRSPCGQACLRSLMLNFFEPNLSLSLSRPQAAKPYGPVDDESAASVSHVSCTGQARCLGRPRRRMPISKWMDSNSSTQIGQAAQC